MPNTYHAIIFQGHRAVTTTLYRTPDCATYHDAVYDARNVTDNGTTPDLLICVYHVTDNGTNEISAVTVGASVAPHNDGHASLHCQINYQINAIDKMHAATGSTNLDVINEFHEVTGMITALRIVDVHADGAHLRRAASQLHRLQIAKNHALTNVTNINALRVVS